MELCTEKITKSLKECLTDTSKVKTNIDDCMVEYKTALTDYETKVRDSEAVDDEQYTTLNVCITQYILYVCL